jgi:ABC-type bacteriocin/lantibiotic exporter with double-glycine peptidase domain
MKGKPALVPACLALVALAGACRSAGVSPTALSSSAVVLPVPVVHQDASHDCGLAALESLCRYWGVEIPLDRRAELARIANERDGLSGRELSDALAELHLESFVFSGTLDRSSTGLLHQIDAGRPPLVMISADQGGPHYCLVAGYDLPSGNLVLEDPLRGQVLAPIDAFDRHWEWCRRFTLVACPESGPRARTAALGDAARKED